MCKKKTRLLNVLGRISSCWNRSEAHTNKHTELKNKHPNKIVKMAASVCGVSISQSLLISLSLATGLGVPEVTDPLNY